MLIEGRSNVVGCEVQFWLLSLRLEIWDGLRRLSTDYLDLFKPYLDITERSMASAVRKSVLGRGLPAGQGMPIHNVEFIDLRYA